MPYSNKTANRPCDVWIRGASRPETGPDAVSAALRRITLPCYIIDMDGKPGVSQDGSVVLNQDKVPDSESYPLYAYAPPLLPLNLGDPRFKDLLGIRYPYLIGAMANGITSIEMVAKAGDAGMLAFFGAAGLTIQEIDRAITALQERLGATPFGFNFIHSPHDPRHEMSLAELYLTRDVRLISASAFIDLTLPLVWYRVKGLKTAGNGDILIPHKLVAKVSRIEVAAKFLAPPPEKLLSRLCETGQITPQEASLARHIPMADALTAEADSGGHTDNRPAISLLPTMLALRNQMQAEHQYATPPFVGLAGGIATPHAVAAAFAMGAAYVLAGSIHQACVESGTSDLVREMLAQCQQADITMAPAADMFEMGVKVQVLKRGTLFPFRAAKLYDLYTRYESLAAIPDAERKVLEKDFFRNNFEAEWENTKAFFQMRDPAQSTKAESDPKHQMALVFRSYLGQSSNWANSGDPARRFDYQVWCGPAMGAFNQWVKGSFLEKPQNRTTQTVAMNLLYGACVLMRATQLQQYGVPVPPQAFQVAPLSLPEILKHIDGNA